MMIDKTKIKKYLTMRFSGELFAVDLSRVRNVIHNIGVQKIENGGGYVAGFIKVDGALIPVIDIKSMIGINDIPCEDTCVIVAETNIKGSRLLSFEADSVHEVLSINASEINPVNCPFGQTGELWSAAKSGYKSLKIIDVNKLCAEVEINENVKAAYGV